MYLCTKIICIVVCSTLVVALDDSRNAQVTQYQYQNEGLGPYRFSFESSDGIKREEEGNLVHPNTDHAAVVVRGSFSYFGPDGVEYKVRYTADENGFHPEGDHFKVPPYVPWVHHHHDDEQPPIVTGERILDTYQNPEPERGVFPGSPTTIPSNYGYGQPVKPTTPFPFPQQPFKQSSRYSAQPIKQTNTFPSSNYDNTRQQNYNGYSVGNTFSNPPIVAQTSYGTPLPPSNTYLTTPKPTPVFQIVPETPATVYVNGPVSQGEKIDNTYISTPQAYLPSTPSPKPVAYVPENIQKTRELAGNSDSAPLETVLEQLQNNIYVPSSTPKSVEITVHSIKPLGTEVNHV